MNQVNSPHGQSARLKELKAKLDDGVSELIATANDDGYGTAESLDALDAVVENQKVIYAEDEDPANDPCTPWIAGHALGRRFVVVARTGCASWDFKSPDLANSQMAARYCAQDRNRAGMARNYCKHHFSQELSAC